MEQAKTRDKKIEITDIAVSKVNPPLVPYFNEEQNAKFKELHRELLRLSMEENESDEVAFLFNPNLLSFEKQYGGTTSVDILENPFAYEMLRRASEKELFLLHNHPSTKTFSYSDIGVLLRHDNLAGITVVTNTGETHVLYKTDRYDFEKAYETIFGIRNEYNEDVLDETHDAEVVKRFLKVCGSCGIKSL